MAQVRLGRFEIESGKLPDVCMRCGAPASTRVNRKFSWRPSELLSWDNPEKKITVPAPMCDRHRRHWAWSVYVNVAFIAFFVLLGVTVFSAAPITDDLNLRSNIQVGCFLGIFAMIPCWILIQIVLTIVSIKPGEITANSILLNGVSEEFVAAVERAREPSRKN